MPSKYNPADLVSRGLKVDHISNSSLWWSGPGFSLKDDSHWPKLPSQTLGQDLPEILSSHINDANIHSNLLHPSVDNN